MIQEALIWIIRRGGADGAKPRQEEGGGTIKVGVIISAIYRGGIYNR